MLLGPLPGPMRRRTVSPAPAALLALALLLPLGAEAQPLTKKEKTAVLSALNLQRADLKQPPAIALPMLLARRATERPAVRDGFEGLVPCHYTQIVSATTTKVGCARSVCPNLAFPITIVCNFGNASNVYDAATGTVNRPYELTAAEMSTGR
jgi:hypothetical protein